MCQCFQCVNDSPFPLSFPVCVNEGEISDCLCSCQQVGVGVMREVRECKSRGRETVKGLVELCMVFFSPL